MKSRLFLKIFIGYFTVLFVVIFLDSLIVTSYTREKIVDQVQNELTTYGRMLVLMPRDYILQKTPSLAEAAGVRITIVDAKGTVLADSDKKSPLALDSHLDRSEIQEARLKGEGTAVRYSQTLKKDMLYYARPVQEKGKITGYIRLAKPVAEVKMITGSFNQIILRTAVIILISFLLISLIFLPRLISPVLQIATYTEKIRRNEPAGNLIIPVQDEVGILARNINLMVSNYQEQIRIIHESREKLQSVFANMSEGIIVLNSEKRIEFANDALTKILGSKYNRIEGQTILAAFHNTDLQEALEIFQKTSKPVLREITVGDIEPVNININISAVKDVAGAAGKTIMVFHDVTQLKKLERMRADFVANVTHEIKTPLTAIIGYAQTLQQGELKNKETASAFLHTIHENAQRLNRLVDDLLTLSSIELGKAQLNLQKVNVAEAIGSALDIVGAKAGEKNIAITRNIPDSLPPLLADADRLTQILVNVLDNAVKFTEAGSVNITAGKNEQGCVFIIITDTGIGIPQRDISRLGERFYRVDKTRSRDLGGTGLGLSIVKHLLKVQNGFLQIESTPGKGTAVSLFFPAA